MDQKLIIENARKTAQRIKKRRNEFSQEEFLYTRISTVPLWKRIIVVCFGLLVALLSVWIFLNESYPVWATVIGLVGIIVLLVGFLGGRKKVNSILNGLDFPVSSRILDAIIDGIF